MWPYVQLLITITFPTGLSMWPVQLSITSLPPSIRMNVDYLLLGGVWLGPVKPDMKVILQPVLDKIKSLNAEMHTPQGVKHLKAQLLLGVFDLPAKAMAMNMKQFNGQYGCRIAWTKVHTYPIAGYTYLLTTTGLGQLRA